MCQYDFQINKVNNSICRILGFKQSVNSLERTDRKMSETTAKFWAQFQRPPADKEGAIMVASADGKWVVMRNSEIKTQKKDDDDGQGNKKMSLV